MNSGTISVGSKDVLKYVKDILEGVREEGFFFFFLKAYPMNWKII